MKKLIVAALSSIFAGAAFADPPVWSSTCFESDKTDVSARTLWSHHHFYLKAHRFVSGGRAHFLLAGWGHNDAPTPNGSFDTVPLSGAAVRDVDGTLLVSLHGNLLQQSHPDQVNHPDQYWNISQQWILNPDLQTGRGHFGNLTTPYHSDRQSFNDSVPIDIWQVPCPE